MEGAAQYKRHTAIKVSVRDLVGGEFVEEDMRSYVRTEKGDVSRANLVGFVVEQGSSETMSRFLIDDGSGKIDSRSWEGVGNNIAVGDLVMVVGRPRMYQGNRYLAVEFVRKIENKDWLRLRKLELGEPGQETSPIDSMLAMIRKLDAGEGVGIERLHDSAPNADALINRLLSQGDIFEVRPGVVRILE